MITKISLALSLGVQVLDKDFETLDMKATDSGSDDESVGTTEILYEAKVSRSQNISFFPVAFAYSFALTYNLLKGNKAKELLKWYN